ncbi:NAD(P)/FAD-dependent oxidoreductase [Mucilaginibacter kameinonensis]|uniref:NAD(P)/FAD-dependent oxidoreductase n=1 Tax=Mucilaginibacter kameinonensis TaxID=452286 RepID=UPI000EF79F75|nr:NAD(P)/FAD-dependent oxidoreductase [Mucilaginibacter kameinonensis]
MKHVFIIGGGFAGINLVKHLAKDKSLEITLVDRNNYNFFPPLLYQVTTGFLDSPNISYPFRKLLRKYKNVHFLMGELEFVNSEKNAVTIDGKDYSYDYLVIATGVSNNYFGMEQVKANAFPMKTLSDALTLKNHLLRQVEKAALTTDRQEREKLLNVVVVGGGPTGVEISGMLADMKRDILAKDHPDLYDKGHLPHLFLVDGLNVVLKPMSDKTHLYALDALTAMGVDVHLGMQVKDYDGETVFFADGHQITTKTLIWAAGVTGIKFAGLPPESYGRGNRIICDQYNKVQATENIYAIGDACVQTHEAAYPAGHPQMAQIAIQQGKNLANNIIAARRHGSLRPFAYQDKGSMAIIGRNRAVVDLPSKKHFQGRLAFFSWLAVHLLSLATAANRLTTFYRWVVAYFTRDQALRMIIETSNKKD